MASTSLRRAVLAGAALTSVFLLAACAPPKSLVESYPGEPRVEHVVEEDEEAAAEEDEHPAADGEPSAVWLGQGGQLAVTLFGSSTCPPVGTRISVVEPLSEGNIVEIETKDYGDGMCTADLVPYTSVFWTPMNVGPTSPLTVRVAGTEIEVPVK
ncbi:hypothetical protein ABIQ69_03905 [Agromyces sp. G08B096]|uniref:Lipoprotein n=1 Tax=Agromyces sp. G08B096 TaxID=3156399 RepID=A0AAU7WAT6_9MICO